MKNKNFKKIGLIALAAIAAVIIVFTYINPGNEKQTSNQDTSTQIPLVKDSDIVINTEDITETATYYPAEIDGTKLEVIAVKASDGSIRTAFNTCQVCYSSGKGYYEQEGDVLVCQNCGNRFGMDDVQVTKGGCNPVPITSEYKTVSDETITISKEFLTQATVIFQNWK